MKVSIKQPYQLQNREVVIHEVNLEDVKISGYALLAIDGSTSNSGLAIIREYDGAILYYMAVTRDSKEESPVRYKIQLKNLVKQLLYQNKFLTQIYYEEPVIANISSVPNLFMLRTFIEELIIEEEPRLDNIKHYEVPNMRWKKEFLLPDKVPSGSKLQKEAVRKKLIKALPFLSDASQDEIDAICMGFVASRFSKEGYGGEELQSKKKQRPFKYNIQFIGADTDDEMITELLDVYDGPEFLIKDEDINLLEINSKTNFDRFVYDNMGDSDRLLIIKFASDKHCDLTLKYKVGNLSASYSYMYALVWRKSRK